MGAIRARLLGVIRTVPDDSSIKSFWLVVFFMHQCPCCYCLGFLLTAIYYTLMNPIQVIDYRLIGAFSAIGALIGLMRGIKNVNPENHGFCSVFCDGVRGKHIASPAELANDDYDVFLEMFSSNVLQHKSPPPYTQHMLHGYG